MTVKTDLGGEGVRRNYSICAPATRAMLRIAVKHLPGGAFSTFVAEQLQGRRRARGDDPDRQFLHAASPAQPQALRRDRRRQRDHPDPLDAPDHLEIETESRFTLIYGNRTKDSTMFRSELDELESRYSDRLEILHVLSAATRSTPPSSADESTATSSSAG